MDKNSVKNDMGISTQIENYKNVKLHSSPESKQQHFIVRYF